MWKILIGAALTSAADAPRADHPAGIKDGAIVMTVPNSSRPPPPAVAPIVHDGVRYEQLVDSRILPGSQDGGALAVRDAATGALLWTLRVYDVVYDSGAPFRPGLYFRRMKIDSAGACILIETEHGANYEVDLTSRTSRRVGGTLDGRAVQPSPKPQ